MRILVATDGSESASVAVRLAGAIDWPPDSTIHLLESVASGVAVFGGPWPPLLPTETTMFDDDIRAQAEQNLSVARSWLAASGCSLETSVAEGRAADVIISVAEHTGADLIVVGSRGHGSLESMLLGSVSAEVIDRADVPVLVARGSAIARVVYACDGSAGAERAARVLMDRGILAASEMLVISVAAAIPHTWTDARLIRSGVDAAAYEEAAAPSRAQHEQLAQEMAQRLRDAGIDARSQLRVGHPAEQIVKAAESWQADLVVMGSHGRTGLRRLLMGSVARNVLHHAPCSVLIVREPHHEQQAPPAIA